MEGLNITIIMKFMSTWIMKTARYVRKEILKSTAEQFLQRTPMDNSFATEENKQTKNPYITYLKF